MLNVLLKNDDSNGFNGGSFSRYEYSSCSVSASVSSFSSRDGRPLQGIGYRVLEGMARAFYGYSYSVSISQDMLA